VVENIAAQKRTVNLFECGREGIGSFTLVSRVQTLLFDVSSLERELVAQRLILYTGQVKLAARLRGLLLQDEVRLAILGLSLAQPGQHGIV